MLRTPLGLFVPKDQYHLVRLFQYNVPNTISHIPGVIPAFNDMINQYGSAIKNLINQLENEKKLQLKEKDDQIQMLQIRLNDSKETQNQSWAHLEEKINQIQTQLEKNDNQLWAHLKEKENQTQAQLKEKDEQICRLHDIISKMQTKKSTPHPPPCEEDDIQMDQNIPILSDVLPKTEESAKSSVVVTNFPEIMTFNDGTLVSDEQKMKDLFQHIDQDAKIVSVKRMGKKDSSKNRPIQVSFRTKNEKKSVLKNAPEYIKSNEQLKEWKVFVNNLVSPDAHKIQVKLTKKKDQLYKARGGNTSIKYFIKEKQIFVHDTISNETKPVECDENMEAAQFYKRNQKSSQKETKNVSIS